MNDWLSKLDPKWVVQNVVGWGFLAIVLWFVSSKMILPMQNAHLDLVKDVSKNTGEIVKVQDKQTPILDRIDRNTSK